MWHFRGKATALVCLAFALAAGTVAWGGEVTEGTWREARGMSRGQGQDIVRVQTVEEKTVAGKEEGKTIRLQYAMPVLKAVDENAAGRGRTVLAMGNAPLAGDAGKPVLPVVPCYVALPAGSEVDTVEVVCGPEAKLPGRHVIAHGQKAVPLVKDAKAEPTDPDPAVYGSDEAWPKARHNVVTVQKKRGMSVVVVNLNPVSYRPKSGAVSSFETMELRVKVRPKAAAAGAEPEVRAREDRIRPLSEKVDNPADLASYQSVMK